MAAVESLLSSSPLATLDVLLSQYVGRPSQPGRRPETGLLPGCETWQAKIAYMDDSKVDGSASKQYDTLVAAIPPVGHEVDKVGRLDDIQGSEESKAKEQSIVDSTPTIVSVSTSKPKLAKTVKSGTEVEGKLKRPRKRKSEDLEHTLHNTIDLSNDAKDKVAPKRRKKKDIQTGIDGKVTKHRESTKSKSKSGNVPTVQVCTPVCMISGPGGILTPQPTIPTSLTSRTASYDTTGLSNDNIVDNVGPIMQENDVSESTSAILNLGDRYNYNDPPAEPTRTPVSEPPRKKIRKPVVKRARAETAVKPSATKCLKTKPPKKPRAPAKKAQTITGVAVAQYRIDDQQTKVTGSVSRYFSPKEANTVTNTSAAADANMETKNLETVTTDKHLETLPPKGRTSKKPRKNAKQKEAPQKLLSPDEALRKADGQEILFGTSSQLVRQESPSSIRDLQRAIEESQVSVHINGVNIKKLSKAVIPRNSTSSVLSAGRGLWSKSTRDDNDALLQAETIQARAERRNAMNFISIETDFMDFAVVQQRATVTEKPGERSADDVFVNIDSVQQDQKVGEQSINHLNTTGSTAEDKSALIDVSRTESSQAMTPQLNKLKLSSSASSKFRNTLMCATPPSHQEIRPALYPLSRNTGTAIASSACHASISTLPEALTGDSILTATAGSKVKAAPKKQRERASKDLAANIDADTDAVPGEAPPKKRGRPKKDDSLGETVKEAPTRRKRITKSTTAKAASKTRNSDEFTNVDEIQDSEVELVSSPERRKSPSKPKALALSQPEGEEEAVAIAKPKNKEEPDTQILFPCITRAIKSAPRSNDIKRPSWYEKILLYDPIVLEDLAAWLNGGALKQAGYAGSSEIRPVLVQKWCEENSICCLWREGLRGGVKAKY